MSHKCEAALITCEDFRLHQRKDGCNYVADFIKKLNIDCDLITRGGAVQDLVRPKKENFDFSLLRDVEVSVKLHSAKIIYLLNHEDCGAYSGMNFATREEELEQHYNDLAIAKKIISARFPEAEIRLYFAELGIGTNDVFKIKEI